MSLWRIAILGAMITFTALLGCGRQKEVKPVDLKAEFNEAEARRMLEQGPNTISGSALIKKRGSPATCAGSDVYLIPATQYAVERIRTIYRSDERGYAPVGREVKFDEEVPAYSALTRTVKCDDDGSFKFENVSDGDFFVATKILFQSGRSVAGGNLMQRVKVSGGEKARIVLSP